jgi:hypothetical protein
MEALPAQDTTAPYLEYRTAIRQNVFQVDRDAYIHVMQKDLLSTTAKD